MKTEKQGSKQKVILTGGHGATVAIATVEEIVLRKLAWELYWLGPYSAFEGRRITPVAEKVLSKYEINLIRIIAGRAKKRGSFILKLWSYLKIPIGFVHAFYWVVKIKPNLVLSFGGFAALPVVVASWFLRIPVIIQEQVVGAGMANRLSAPFASVIAVARMEAQAFFPKEKTVVIGNPQVKNFFEVKKKTKLGKPPVIYITGGSTGSQIINETVESILRELLAKYRLIHQTGDTNINYYRTLREGLTAEEKSRYEVFGYRDPEKIARVFEKADIIISRAGGNSVSDIVNSGRPAILIPIPWTIGDEQGKNAQKAKNTGLAVILDEDKLSGETLKKKIEEVVVTWPKMVKGFVPGDFTLDRGAASKLVSLAESQIIK